MGENQDGGTIIKVQWLPQYKDHEQQLKREEVKHPDQIKSSLDTRLINELFVYYEFLLRKKSIHLE